MPDEVTGAGAARPILLRLDQFHPDAEPRQPAGRFAVRDGEK